MNHSLPVPWSVNEPLIACDVECEPLTACAVECE